MRRGDRGWPVNGRNEASGNPRSPWRRPDRRQGQRGCAGREGDGMNVAICPDRLNFISICTGGGGLDLGVELAIPSARSVCMVEREAFGCAQLVSAMEAGYLAPAP